MTKLHLLSQVALSAVCVAALSLATPTARAEGEPPNPGDSVAGSVATQDAPSGDSTAQPADTSQSDAPKATRHHNCPFSGKGMRAARPIARIARAGLAAGAVSAVTTTATLALGAGLTAAVAIPACAASPAACRGAFINAAPRANLPVAGGGTTRAPALGAR